MEIWWQYGNMEKLLKNAVFNSINRFFGTKACQSAGIFALHQLKSAI